MSGIIAYLLVVGVLLAVTARAAEEVLRLGQRPVRWAWVGALALMVVLAARAAVTGLSPGVVQPQLTLPVPAQPAGEQVDPAPWAAVLTLAERAPTVIAGIPEGIARRIAPVFPPPFAKALAVAWAAASLAVLVLIGLVYWRLSSAVRSLPATTLHGTRVRISRSAGPAVVGVLAPQIIVPAWLLHAPEEEQRLAVAHEREHVAARDPQLLIAACVAAAAIPWHPAAWWMLSRLRLAVEIDCDRRVIASGMPRRLYGRTLIDIAARGGRLPFGVPALAGHPTHLERRLIAMAPVMTPYRRIRLLSAGAGMLLTIAAACEARLPSSPEIDAMDAAAVENNPLVKIAVGGDTTISYYVDGSLVTAEASRSVAARDIASIEVKKGAARKEIRITTKAAAAASVADAGPGLVPPPKTRGEPVLEMPPNVGGLRPLSFREYAGLIFIDGKPADEQTMAALTPDRIASMEVIKGAAARRLYDDPRAANGVIRVTTMP